MLEERARSWVERAWGRHVERVDPLHGGWTSTMLRLTVDDGAEAVLRMMTVEPWRRHAAALLGREAAVQHQLAVTSVPAPVSIAVDPEGRTAGAPVHLMSALPGSVELDRADDGFLLGLVDLMHRIHGVDPGPDRPRVFQSWAHPAKRVVPAWTRRPEMWREAFRRLEQDPPAWRGTFLHRDFHVGNVLWKDGAVTGVVDWVETSWGPAWLDAAHCTTYLAMLHGPEAARRFLCAYRAGPGEALEPDAERYWHLMDIVGYLPDPKKVAQPWRELGRHVSDELARARLEEHLAAVLAS